MAYDGRSNSETRPLPHAAHPVSLTSQDTLQGLQASNELSKSTAMGATTQTYVSDDSFVEMSDSSPSSHGVGAKETASSSDKKRSKLGYHRTAVACGHCRRRKIRCIPAIDDESGRCQNCIRLKKECQFFPVDLPGQPLNKAAAPAASNPEAAIESLTHTPSTSPGKQFGPLSTIQAQENDETNIAAPLTLHDPFQGQWIAGVAGVNQQADFPPRQDLEYRHPHHHHHQPIHPSQPLNYPGPANSFDNPLQPYMTPSQQQQQQQQQQHQENIGSFGQSPYVLMGGSSSITTPSESGGYHFSPQNAGMGQAHWTPESTSRSVSISDADELHRSYHHADTYISMNRRMYEVTETTNLQQHQHHQQQQQQHIGVGHQMNNEHVGVGGVSSPYHEPTMLQHAVPHLQQQQAIMGWQMDMHPGVGHHPVPVSDAAPNQAWYLASGSPQAAVQQQQQQQQQHPQFYASQQAPGPYHPFQPNPG